MYKVKEYSKLSSLEKDKFHDTLRDQVALDAKSPAMENMYSPSWRTESHTLRHLLEVDNVFAKNHGAYYVLLDDDKFVASGGVHFSEWSNNIAMGGIRTWVHTDYRNKFLAADYILPACKKWAVKNGCNIITLTFNEYNKNLIKTWTRIRAGENKTRIRQRKSKHIFYNNLVAIDYPLEINYTKQWLIYENLSEIFDFNWQEIKWKDKIKIVKRKLG
jgi:hypothetical protein